MKWKKQYDKRNCGQIAVAVITGKSLRKVYEIIGHDKATSTKDLAKALRKFGYSCPNRLKRLKEKPKLAIAKLSHKLRSGWHWIVIDRNKIYDGNYGTKNGTVKWKQGHKVTSYLPIKKRK